MNPSPWDAVTGMESTVLTLGYYALSMLISLSLPLLLSALLVGLTFSLLQALSSVQEQTLSFVPKMVTVFTVALLLGPMFLSRIIGFAQYIFRSIPTFMLTN